MTAPIRRLRPPLPVILASSSPQRRELLGRILSRFEILPPDVAETVCTQDVRRLVMDLAARKAEHAARQAGSRAIVIGADTVACCAGEIIGKPADTEAAVRALMKLSRHPHSVLTGLCVIAPNRRWLEAVETRIWMRPLARAEAERFARLEGATDRAGAYAIQEQADEFVERIEGSLTNVIGLPLERLCGILLSIDGTVSEPQDAVEFQLGH